ncbi:serine/threonine protein kinase [Streptomyces piniterrae]|uniref:Serine/threonine protein kinase n=1 Tax=Streptomyces piniterrae TaxID=2571125 RepID=A0A4U0NS03_9ACTN|nr:class III lanthionine synthetase LanKC [Streptomyces piniterrae]TJZ57391.1 serine/threonine protein kinase [Streptomyces piniterrae]
MKMRHQQFSLIDPVFYETPYGVRPGDTSFAVGTLTPPDGWQRHEGEAWLHLAPKDRQLPDQGWKIHVSARPENAERVLRKVWQHCTRHRLAFKFLRTPRLHLLQNSKYADRSSSGKLATLYPCDEQELEATLNGLAAELGEEPGPYILSDLRWGAGPLHVRYGGFAERYCTDLHGEPVLAIERPDGQLVPDERRPAFHLPSWVPLPDFLTPHRDARNDKAGAEQFPYDIDGVLHFSNGGGVYSARAKSDGTRVVLKEARPHIGSDSRQRDAQDRLHHEARMLRRLDGLPGVPAFHRHFTEWEHHFLAMEHVEGTPLTQWVVLHHPLTRACPDPQEIRRYADQVRAIIERTRVITDSLLERGTAHGDLHPGNLIVADDGSVHLVDFEFARDRGEDPEPGLGAPGFVPPPGLTDEQAHRFATAAIWLHCMLPLSPLLELAPEKTERQVREVQQLFELPHDICEAFLDDLRPTPKDAAPPRREVGDSPLRFGPQAPPWSEIRASAARALTLSATPHRQDRLFPGDVKQFPHGGSGFAYGAAGVLHALATAGRRRDPRLEEWLLESVTRRTPLLPGFYDGALGISYALDGLGYRDAADRLVAQALGRLPEVTGANLFDGLAGTGLQLLRRTRSGQEDHRAVIGEIANRLAGSVESGVLRGSPGGAGGQRQDPGTRRMTYEAGLLYGWSGVALFFLHLQELTKDEACLDLARRALHRDLDSCVELADGSVQIRDDANRALPYLANGGAGIALIADLLLAVRHDDRSAEALPGLLLACTPELVLGSGLFHGRAGLLAVLSRLTARRPELGHGTSSHRLLGTLDRHALSYRGHLAFPGDHNLRLSMDVATGTAGVLLALKTAYGKEDTEFLPFISLPGDTPGPDTEGSPRSDSATEFTER